MIEVILNIGLFLLGGVIGGFFVGRKMTEDIENIMETQDELMEAYTNANNTLRRLGVKDGE
jgi:uncharacterized membrane protein YqgA involved in biofilm formation